VLRSAKKGTPDKSPLAQNCTKRMRTHRCPRTHAQTTGCRRRLHASISMRSHCPLPPARKSRASLRTNSPTKSPTKRWPVHPVKVRLVNGLGRHRQMSTRAIHHNAATHQVKCSPHAYGLEHMSHASLQRGDATAGCIRPQPASARVRAHATSSSKRRTSKRKTLKKSLGAVSNFPFSTLPTRHPRGTPGAHRFASL
jgi:hypothetical protein